MPSRNIVRQDSPESYYHVYARGHNKQAIFLDNDDFEYFTNLFSRYMSKAAMPDRTGVPYPHFARQLRLLAYCLMPNHFHLLVFQLEENALGKLMQCIMVSYTRYFNHKYKKRGPLFESTYKSSPITDTAYLEHISRYIHLNPRYWKRYKHSSLRFYLQLESPEWLQPQEILSMFSNRTDYLNFNLDYIERKQELDDIKEMLADS
jgi:putative transposase